MGITAAVTRAMPLVCKICSVGHRSFQINGVTYPKMGQNGLATGYQTSKVRAGFKRRSPRTFHRTEMESINFIEKSLS
jgi:hypothetical protein